LLEILSFVLAAVTGFAAVVWIVMVVASLRRKLWIEVSHYGLLTIACLLGFTYLFFSIRGDSLGWPRGTVTVVIIVLIGAPASLTLQSKTKAGRFVRRLVKDE
jgi:hypothetical protein